MYACRMQSLTFNSNLSTEVLCHLENFFFSFVDNNIMLPWWDIEGLFEQFEPVGMVHLHPMHLVFDGHLLIMDCMKQY